MPGSRMMPGGLLAALGALCLLLAACGGGGGAGDSLRQEIDTMLEEGRHEELAARLELERRQGSEDPWVYYGLGVVRLSEDADRPAVVAFDRAVAADSTLGPTVAAVWTRAAEDDLAEDWNDRALRRMAQAWTYDQSVDLGDMADPVADRFYRFDKDYPRALVAYRQLIRDGEGPEAKQAEWWFRYGHCLEVVEEDRPAAMDAYRTVLERFAGAKGQVRYSTWRLQRNLLDRAAERREAGDAEGALADASEAHELGWHEDLRQEARLVMGELAEARGDDQAALGWYREIVESGLGAEIVDRAKLRIEALADRGVW